MNQERDKMLNNICEVQKFYYLSKFLFKNFLL